MFDSSSKFPSGVLSGSSYDFGNFDECIEVKVPLENDEEISGKYCMAQFHIDPPNLGGNDKGYVFNFYNGGNSFNVSTWEKILVSTK